VDERFVDSFYLLLMLGAPFEWFDDAIFFVQ